MRTKGGESARVERYFERYPELSQDRTVVRGLIAAEYKLRLRREPDLGLDEYYQRFPDDCDWLRSAAARGQSQPGPGDLGDEFSDTAKGDRLSSVKRFPIRLNCPHCHNPITVVEDLRTEEVVCPCCGSTFRLSGDRSVSWQPGNLPRLGKLELLEAVGRARLEPSTAARDTELDRIVAVKIPRSGAFATQEDEDRFVREARSASR